MSASAATATPRCGHTQGALMALHEKHFEQQHMWRTLFFLNEAPPHPFHTRDTLPGAVPRCLKCGDTIDEHSAAMVPQSNTAGLGGAAGLDAEAMLAKALRATLPRALAKYEIEKFMQSHQGICDAASASSAQRSNTKEWVRARQDKFGRCIVTETELVRGSPPPGQRMPEFKLAHIVQRKVKNSDYLMTFFHLKLEELDADSNILLMRSDVEAAFDNADFCFLPVPGVHCFCVHWMGSGTKPDEYQSIIVMPEFISRRMLMIHAMDAHRKHKREFDAAQWDALAPRPSSTAGLVQAWLDGQRPISGIEPVPDVASASSPSEWGAAVSGIE